jgi:hypothetical protein
MPVPLGHSFRPLLRGRAGAARRPYHHAKHIRCRQHATQMKKPSEGIDRIYVS